MSYTTSVIGGVQLRVWDHELVIKKDGDWTLVECTAHSKNGWKSLKLYLNRYTKKNVWRLGVKGSYLARSYDAMLLVTFYPAMRDWVVEQANGRNVPLPADDKALETARIPVPEKIKDFVINEIMDRAFKELAPLSNKGQTKKLGRYVVHMIAQQFKISEPKAKYHIETMIKDGIIEFAMIDKHKRISGLRLVKGATNG